ncbi:MAG: right-handed parallel beta-helix repeat-containing protein [Saprospiraceae bacterium]
MNRTLMLVLLIIVSNLLCAKNYHVQPLGSDNNDGLSFAKAFKTIQKATNLVVAGDSILVYDGFYKGWDHFYKNSGVQSNPIVYFAKGQNVIINQSCGRGFDGLNIEGCDWIEVNGFRVQSIADPNGSGEDGIRAVLSNHIIIRNCIVDSCYRGIFTGYTDDFLAENNICKRSFGEHGIYVSNNSDEVTLRFNVCYGNKAAGIQLNPDVSSGSPGLSYHVFIYNNICYNNRIGLNLQGLYYSYVYNNLLYNNGSNNGGNGITLFHGDAATGCNDVKVFNNTVVVPNGSQWAILAVESDSLWIVNNILISFSSKGCLDIESSCSNYYGDYNILNDRMTTDQGNSYINFAQWQNKGHDLHSILAKDNSSLFEDLTNNDYHLSALSAARNSGSSQVANLVSTDLDNEKRPQGNSFDIGCYEFRESTQVDQHEERKFDYILKYQDDFLIVEGLEEGQSIMLTNLFGQVIERAERINISNLTHGIYFISIVSHNGYLLATVKVDI